MSYPGPCRRGERHRSNHSWAEMRREMQRLESRWLSLRRFDGRKLLGDRSQDGFLDCGERAGDPRTGGECVAATAVERAYFAYINLRVLGTEADPHFALGKFFDEGRNDDAFDGADSVN